MLEQPHWKVQGHLAYYHEQYKVSELCLVLKSHLDVLAERFHALNL